MKLNEVVIGGVYLTRVSGELTPVRVLRQTKVRVGNNYSANKFQTAFAVQAHATGRDLPKPRKAAALRHTKLSRRVQLVVGGLQAGLQALTR